VTLPATGVGEHCEHPEVITGWHSLADWAKVLIPTLIAILLTLGGSAVAFAVQARGVETQLTALDAARHEDREEVRRLASDLVRLEREAAVRHTELLQTLARLETQLAELHDAQVRREATTRVR
jgi:hypothetical protein